jgi:hypothetical protein
MQAEARLLKCEYKVREQEGGGNKTIKDMIMMTMKKIMKM